MSEHLRRSTDRLENRLEFETLIAELSSRFIALPPGEIDGEIEAALRRICELLEFDLAVLWQWSTAAPDLITPTHTYYAWDGPLPSEPMRQEDYPWSRQQVLAGRLIVVPSLAALPEEAAVDRETCRRFGIQAVLCLPLAVGGKPSVGALGFNCLQTERDWPDALVKRLQFVGQIFTNALARKRHELQLRESEERLSLAADAAGVGLWTLDYGTRFFWATEKARTIFGYSVDEIITMESFEALIHPEDLDLVRRTIERSVQRRLAIDVEYRIVRPDGSVRWIASRGTPRFKASGELDRVMGVSIDITESKRSEESLRELSRHLIGAHEEERALLARELHDDVTQRLAVLAIDVGRAELAAPDGPNAEAMRLVREGLVRLSEDVHTLAYQLHPSVLEELGLGEALRTECERLGRRSGVALSVELEAVPAGVEKDATFCLFRVAQESLNNVARHAGARNATVTLRQMDGGLLLAVRDDGVGFDPEAPRRRRSLGLASMRERVRLVNGTLDIESAPGEGTVVVAWVPGNGGPQ